MRRSRKIAVAAGLAVLLTVGVAVAAWLVNGTGPGTARAATAVQLTVAAGATPATGDLYPGSTTGDVYVTVTNPNAFPVTLTSATVGGTVTPSNCAITVNTGPFPLTGTTLAANASAQVTIADALSMGAAADTSCQGAEITLGTVVVSGTSGTTP